MKRIALFPVLIAAFVSAASAEPAVEGKPGRVFVSVQLNDGQSSLPISSLTIANGATGTVYVENDLPYVERAEKAKAEKIGAAATPPSDSEDGITMHLTPTVTADGQIDVEFLIRKPAQPEANGDAPQAAATEVRHRATVRNGQPSIIEIDAPAKSELLPAVESAPAYTVKLVAQKI